MATATTLPSTIPMKKTAAVSEPLPAPNLDFYQLLEDETQEEHGFDEIVGRSAVLRAVLREVEIVSPTDSTVLIYGETGTGKELIARAIHDRSSRHKNAFVKLNCAAIPTGLLESELFGHEKARLYRSHCAAHRPLRVSEQRHDVP